MHIKLSKIVLVWSIALFATLVVFGNVTDYGSNYAFVYHVLKMDTVPPNINIKWRAIESSNIYTAAYIFIICSESVIALLCWMGGWRLLKAIKSADNFNRAKGVAILGLTLGIIVWFTGFLTIGGEWFAMWQSHKWNGQEPAFRLIVIFGIILIYLNMPDIDENAKQEKI